MKAIRTVRASEVGSFIYCQRAWWYQRRGVEPENVLELTQGTQRHAQHGRAVFAVGCLRAAAYGMLLLALLLVVVHFTVRVI